MVFKQLKTFCEKHFGLRIYRNSLPKGFDPFFEIKKLAEYYSIPINNFFDVGANIGQSTIAFKSIFPNAMVNAFEPVSTTFKKLKGLISYLPNVHLHEMALGSTRDQIEMYTGTRSDLFSLSDSTNTGEKQMIEIRKLDDIVRETGISKISVLKIDTEGHDLNVLKGGIELLKIGMVDFIIVETTLFRNNGKFIHINEFTDFLSPLGYDLMSICNQEGWHIRTPFIFCNALFQKRRDWYS